MLDPWDTWKSPSHGAGAACGGSGLRDGLEPPPAPFGSRVLPVCSREGFRGCWDEMEAGWAIPGCGLCRSDGTSPAFQTSWGSPSLLQVHGSLPRCCCAPWGHPWSKSHCSCWETSGDGAGRADSSFLIQGWPHKTGACSFDIPSECPPEGGELRAPTPTGEETGRVFQGSWNGSGIQAGGVWLGGNPCQGRVGRVKPWWH